MTLHVQLKSQIAGQNYDPDNQRALFEKRFGNVLNGMAQFEPGGRFVCINANAAMLQLLGFARAEDFFAHPRYFLDYVAPAWRDKVAAELLWLADLGEAHAADMAYEILTRDSQRLWVKNAVCVVEFGTTRFMQCAMALLPQPERQETGAAALV